MITTRIKNAVTICVSDGNMSSEEKHIFNYVLEGVIVLAPIVLPIVVSSITVKNNKPDLDS